MCTRTALSPSAQCARCTEQTWAGLSQIQTQTVVLGCQPLSLIPLGFVPYPLFWSLSYWELSSFSFLGTIWSTGSATGLTASLER